MSAMELRRAHPGPEVGFRAPGGVGEKLGYTTFGSLVAQQCEGLESIELREVGVATQPARLKVCFLAADDFEFVHGDEHADYLICGKRNLGDGL